MPSLRGCSRGCLEVSLSGVRTRQLRLSKGDGAPSGSTRLSFETRGKKLNTYVRTILGVYLAVIGSMVLVGADWTVIRPMLGAGMMLAGFGIIANPSRD